MCKQRKTSAICNNKAIKCWHTWWRSSDWTGWSWLQLLPAPLRQRQMALQGLLEFILVRLRAAPVKQKLQHERSYLGLSGLQQRTQSHLFMDVNAPRRNFVRLHLKPLGCFSFANETWSYFVCTASSQLAVGMNEFELGSPASLQRFSQRSPHGHRRLGGGTSWTPLHPAQQW